MKRIAIIGAGGHGREILDIVEAINAVESRFCPVGFLVDPEFGAAGTIVNDQPILGGLDWLAAHATEVEVACAIGMPEQRLQVVQRVSRCGAAFCTLIHPSAVLTSWVELGVGVIVAAGCVVTNRVKLGNHVHLNVGCTVSHDSIVEDFVSLAPGVHLAGRVTVETGCHIGIGANVIDGIRIGRWSVIGAGSAVMSDVPSNTTAVGVPCRVIKTKPDGWHVAGRGA